MLPEARVHLEGDVVVVVVDRGKALLAYYKGLVAVAVARGEAAVVAIVVGSEGFAAEQAGEVAHRAGVAVVMVVAAGIGRGWVKGREPTVE